MDYPVHFHLAPFVYAGQSLTRQAGVFEQTAFERLCYRLVMPVSGALCVQQSHAEVLARPGVVVLAEPGAMLSFKSEVHFIRIACDLLPRRRRLVKLPPHPTHATPEPLLSELFAVSWDGKFPQALAHQAASTVKYLHRTRPLRLPSMLRSNARLGMLFAELVSYFGDDVQTRHSVRPFDKRVDELLIAGHKHDITIAEVAAQIGMTATALGQKYRRVRGFGPKRFLLEHRVYQAQLLLETTDHIINDIAKAVGFKHANSLRSAFRTVTGLTPTDWRRRVQDLPERSSNS